MSSSSQSAVAGARRLESGPRPLAVIPSARKSPRQRPVSKYSRHRSTAARRSSFSKAVAHRLRRWSAIRRRAYVRSSIRRTGTADPNRNQPRPTEAAESGRSRLTRIALAISRSPRRHATGGGGKGDTECARGTQVCAEGEAGRSKRAAPTGGRPTGRPSSRGADLEATARPALPRRR